jgi:nitroimidazol reductase NimA-like FMN-containing flavoprotein (pyridoxamine 5'-phosphate oxidase superfamily)
MGVLDGRTWLEVLPDGECWELIAQEEIGRVAVLVDGAPEIYPINHTVWEGAILFRTDRGSKLRGIVQSPMVCFEVDGTSPAAKIGWSVMVKGRAVELTEGADVARAAGEPLAYWGQGEKSHWIKIEPRAVTGRRIYRRPAAPPQP